MSNLVSISDPSRDTEQPSGSKRTAAVLDNVPDASEFSNRLVVSVAVAFGCSPSACTNNTAVTAKPLPPSPVHLPLFCAIPGLDPCSPTQLDSTVWSRTQTSVGFVVEVAFKIHMRHMSTQLLVCRPVVVFRHVSTCPQVVCWSSDLSFCAVCATLRPLF